MNTKYIFVTGGVVSGIGKGIIGASLGRLLKSRGFKITIQKLDPYINVDAGTMNPLQHGEVFVTEDGSETDLDLGHYERFIDENLTSNSSITAGKIYWSVINKERQGQYLGKTVQVVPHIINEIKERIFELSKNDADFAIVEIGGTVGDIESQPFIEAIRQIYLDLGRENVMYIHNTLITTIPNSSEQKSKPTQHSVKELLSFGIQPDIIICRSSEKITTEIRSKIALFCNINSENVIENLNVENLYDVPLMLERQKLAEKTCKRLKINYKEPCLNEWISISKKIKNLKNKTTIALVGKYVGLRDAYLSIEEALKHAGYFYETEVKINWINSENIKNEMPENVLKANGIIIPGGFGYRGIDGKIAVSRYARQNNVPIFGICLGMQIMVIEFARNVLGLNQANSVEFDENTTEPVVSVMKEQKNLKDKGGTMRLGAYPCFLTKDSKTKLAYGGKKLILERHRHRYEVNNFHEKLLNEKGMLCVGKSPCGKYIEIIELENHPWAIGVQFHPEFKTRPNNPHPLFKMFIKNSIENKKTQQTNVLEECCDS